MGMPMQGAPMPGKPMPVGTAMQPQRPVMAGAPPMAAMPPQQAQNALMQRARGFY
jgi:hypothetical protein